MSPDRWAAVERAFARALGHPPSHRAALLDDACRTPSGDVDHDLKTEVEALLAAHAASGALGGHLHLTDLFRNAGAPPLEALGEPPPPPSDAGV